MFGASLGPLLVGAESFLFFLCFAFSGWTGLLSPFLPPAVDCHSSAPGGVETVCVFTLLASLHPCSPPDSRLIDPSSASLVFRLKARPAGRVPLRFSLPQIVVFCARAIKAPFTTEAGLAYSCFQANISIRSVRVVLPGQASEPRTLMDQCLSTTAPNHLHR